MVTLSMTFFLFLLFVAPLRRRVRPKFFGATPPRDVFIILKKILVRSLRRDVVA